jgi:cytidylate kinase
MSVITISMKVGSEGSHIAEKVAQTLGYHLADKRRIGTILGQYGLVEFDKEYDSTPGFWAYFDTRRAKQRELVVGMLNQVILALARHGDMVILGRGSFAVLGGFADVLNVRIQAPLPIRIKRVMEQQNITEPDRAEAFVTENDRVRVAFVESSYGIRWDTASPFDLVIDTGKVAPGLAATWLVEANRVVKGRKGGDERTTGTIQVDPILASAVSEAFGCHIAHSE